IQIEVVSRAAGPVSQVAVQEGEAVEAGQLLVALDPTDLRLAVTRARASLTSAQANLRKLLAGPSEAELLRQEHAVAQARLQVERLAREVGQTQRLAAQGAVAPAEPAQLGQDLAPARRPPQPAEPEPAGASARPGPAGAGAVAPAELAQLEQDLALARRQLQLAEQELAELTAGPDPADVEVAQAQVAEAEANLALAEEELKWAEIRSPLTGTVLSVQV